MGLVCPVNISEGRSPRTVDALASAAGDTLLDVHRDADHHRCVLTLGSDDGAQVEAAARDVAALAVDLVDLRRHRGAHPRFGVVDVVPFVPLVGTSPLVDGDLTPAVAARDRFAAWAGARLQVPCFCYGPGRSLPEVRRRAFRGLSPDTGPCVPHPSAGACAVGARFALVAWNLWLDRPDREVARTVAAALRSPSVRSLAFAVGGHVQVSCNLVDPCRVGPANVYDTAETLLQGTGVGVDHAELVGLAPQAVVDTTDPRRWAQLDLDPQRTVEARLGSVRTLRRPPGG